MEKVDLLTIALDFGGSGLKAIYTDSDNKSQTLFMESHTFAAELKSLKEKTMGGLRNTDPENIVWVGFDNVFMAVGYLAANRYLSNQSLSKKKYYSAFYRTLAAIWVILQKLKLEKCQLSLGIILPPGEFEDGHELCNMIKKACSTGFITPTGTMKVDLAFIQCFPEGAGVCSLHSSKNKQSVKLQTTGVVMVGYRNASMLINYRGVLDGAGRTSNLGMVRLIESVQQKTSGLTTEALLKAISEAGANYTPIKFYPLTERDATMEQRQSEIKKIIEAVKVSKSEYLTALKGWLYEVLPNSLDAIVLCGGTADYLKEELGGCFPGIPLNWHGDFVLQSNWENQGLGNRLADVYGVSKILVALSNKTRAIA